MRIIHLFVIAALVFAAAYVYRIKMESTARTERVLRLNAEIREQRDAIAGLRIPHQDSLPDAIVTVSVGVAAAGRLRVDRGDLLSGTGLRAAADRALFDAKSAGRARCWVSAGAASALTP